MIVNNVKIKNKQYLNENVCIKHEIKLRRFLKSKMYRLTRMFKCFKFQFKTNKRAFMLLLAGKRRETNNKSAGNKLLNQINLL